MRSFFAFLLMLLVPLVLIWLPVPGLAALIGGFVGGYVAARPGRAFLLALLPVVIFDVLALLIATGLGLPVIGAVVAGAASIILIAHSVALIVGAIVGGFVGQSRAPELSAGVSYR
jgi:hypothetical protein